MLGFVVRLDAGSPWIGGDQKMDPLVVVLLAGGGIFLFFFFLRPVTAVFAWVGLSIAKRIVYPVESSLLRWLQDRATARAFGTSIEVVRVRRKADTGG